MQKLLNDPRNFVQDCLEGILSAYPDFYRTRPGSPQAMVLAHPANRDRVSIVTGGGMGHLPLFWGYVGEGLCAGAAVGHVFSTPGYDNIAWVTEQVPHQKGVLYIIGNYTGDIMNFEMAASKAQAAGIDTKTVIVSDDVATAPREEWQSRRCIAGIALVYKIAGAAAAMGLSLDEVALVAQKANEQVASMGVAFSACQLPGTQTPIFSIGDNDMELGIGIHGEPGVRRTKVVSSRRIADMLFEHLSTDLNLQSGEKIALMVNGLGATSQEELFILFGDLHTICREKGIDIALRYIGNYSTSLGMNGASASVLRLNDSFEQWLSAPSFSPLVRY